MAAPSPLQQSHRAPRSDAGSETEDDDHDASTSHQASAAKDSNAVQTVASRLAELALIPEVDVDLEHLHALSPEVISKQATINIGPSLDSPCPLALPRLGATCFEQPPRRAKCAKRRGHAGPTLSCSPRHKADCRLARLEAVCVSPGRIAGVLERVGPAPGGRAPLFVGRRGCACSPGSLAQSRWTLSPGCRLTPYSSPVLLLPLQAPSVRPLPVPALLPSRVLTRPLFCRSRRARQVANGQGHLGRPHCPFQERARAQHYDQARIRQREGAFLLSLSPSPGAEMLMREKDDARRSTSARTRAASGQGASGRTRRTRRTTRLARCRDAAAR